MMRSIVGRVGLPAILGFAISAASAAGNSNPGDGPQSAPLTPRSLPKIHGSEVEKSVGRLVADVHWHRDLTHALAVAKEEGKPVFWLQLVGELDDGL